MKVETNRWPLNMLIAIGAPETIVTNNHKTLTAIARSILCEYDTPRDGRINMRTLLRLKYRDGCQNASIAHHMGISENTIGSSMLRIRELAKEGYIRNLLNGDAEPCDAFLDSRPIDALMFGSKCALALKNSGIKTLGEIREFSAAGMLDDIPGIGTERSFSIKARLENYYGLTSVPDTKLQKPMKTPIVSVKIPQKDNVAPAQPSEDKKAPSFPFGKPTVLSQPQREKKDTPTKKPDENQQQDKAITSAPVAPPQQTNTIKPSWVHRPKEKIVDRRFLLVGGRHRLKKTYEKDANGDIHPTNTDTIDDASIFNGFIPIDNQELNERHAQMRLEYEIEKHPGMNHITVFVTGNCEAQVAIINTCRRLNLGLTFMVFYYDKKTYYPMTIAD